MLIYIAILTQKSFKDIIGSPLVPQRVL